MEQTAIPASFMRGGTSKGLFFRWDDVPADPVERDAFLSAAIGAPDPNGRQLDGMGGGISSLSKAMLVRRSEREGIDVDYLFAQIAIREAEVDYGGNCGNLSAAVGAFAVDQGFVQLPDGQGTVRMFNVNTAKRIDCHLEVRGGRSAVAGRQEIAGVAGQGAPIRLEFHDPGGARTGQLMPLGGPVTVIDGIDLSFVDAANPCVFVGAADFGLTGCELPADLSAMPDVLDRLEALRLSAGAAVDAAGAVFEGAASVPKVALVGPPATSATLAGGTVAAEDCDVQIRMISMGAPHLAIPLTGAMCAAVAAKIPRTVVSELARPSGEGPVRIGTPSGVVPAFADVQAHDDGWHARSASVLRTARTLMEGKVFAPMMREAAE